MFNVENFQKKMFELSMNSFKPMPETDPSFVTYGDLRISKKARNSYMITGTFSLLKSVGNDFKAKYEAQHKDNSGVYRVMMTANKNACDFLKSENFFYSDLQKVSNMPDQTICPFPKVNFY